MPRPPCIHHCTSEPYRFFGRDAELALLDDALRDGESVIALIGPGGQGKTAIAQHWLERLHASEERPDGVFLWSFYRGKDADLCLRSLYAYAEGLDQPPELSASYCVDHLLPRLRRERWAIVLDGTEVVQYDSGSKMWVISGTDGRALRSVPAIEITPERILALTLGENE